MNLHHVGIATRDADQAATRFQSVLGGMVVHEEEFSGLDIRFLDLGELYLEFLEPTAEGTVSRFLSRNGPGLHHLGMSVSDINAALVQAVEAGVQPIDETPRPGAWGHDVAFLHPDSTGGVLLELVDHP